MVLCLIAVLKTMDLSLLVFFGLRLLVKDKG